jgi:hypothetical protein
VLQRKLGFAQLLKLKKLSQNSLNYQRRKRRPINAPSNALKPIPLEYQKWLEAQVLERLPDMWLSLTTWM